MLNDLLIRLRALFRREAVEGELDDELRFHFDQQVEKFVRSGMPLEEARRRARLIFGGQEKIKEDCRDERGTRWLEEVWQDVRYAARTLAKKPGFTAVAVLSLTLGIGGNTTIFTLVKAVFLHSIPVKDPSTVVVVYATQQTADGDELKYLQSSYLNAKDYREKNDVFSGLSMFMDAGDKLALPGSAKTMSVDAQLVNWDFFDILGVRPILGRSFTLNEDLSPDAGQVVILSYALWKTQFGADGHILGETVRINQQEYKVIGVMPREFQQAGAIGSPDLWAPMVMRDHMVTDARRDAFLRRRSWAVFMAARLKPGVSLADARVSMRAQGDRLAVKYPDENSGRNVELVPLSETNVPPAQHGLFLLVGSLVMGIVGLVLLIACGNVANLLLVRAMQRRRELAIRLSLGATRGRLIRQLLTESLLLGLMGAVMGIALAYWGRNLLWQLLPGGKPPKLDFSLDGRVLLFTLAISIVATLLFGLVPSLQASKAEKTGALRDRADSPGGTSRWYGLRGILVMAQIAFSLIALVGSALFIQSLRNANQVDPGFETKHELLVFLTPGSENYSQARAEEYYREATERVRALPTVAAAGISNSAPFSPFVSFTTFPEDVDTSNPSNGSLFTVVAVAPGFFSAAGIPLLRGRDVNDCDGALTEHVVVVNQALADQLWKGRDPIGRHLGFVAQPWKAEVVGVVGTVKSQTLGEAPQPLLYFPLKQLYFPNVVLYVRTKGEPNAAAPGVRAAVQILDPAMPLGIYAVPTLMNGMLTAPRFAAELLACFGVLALLLAAIGTYGVMSYSVSQRSHEIGVRMALGAQRGDVLRMILSNGMAMVLAGVVAGLGASVLFTRSINSLLYGIDSFDAESFFAAAVVSAVVAFVACWLPARSAMRVDPVDALRYE
jgi:predicted permease